MSNVLVKVKEIVAEQLGIETSEISPTSNFMEDLGADSLDAVELVMAFEDAFTIEISDEAAEQLRTVGEVVNYIDAHKE
jgi:acyl carrier protein